jgi:hypothetical protein
MVLGRGSQSCVRNGDKAAQRYQKSGGEAHRISLENVSQRQCGDFHGFVYAFHMYLLAEFQFGSRFAFRLGANGENVFRFSKYPGAAFSIPRHAPVESDQSDEWWSSRLVNPFQSSKSTRF